MVLTKSRMPTATALATCVPALPEPTMGMLGAAL